MYFVDSPLQCLSHKLQHIPYGQPIAVACSGGVDSMVLLYMLTHLAKWHTVYAVIVNHNLQPNSRNVANQTAQIVTKWGAVPIILEWNHPDFTFGIEEKARKARYEMISMFCHQNSVKTVFLGHHIDDKIETFLMNSSRGVGLRGICSMQEEVKIHAISYLRPMLYMLDKTQIVQIAKNNNIPWFEDASNKDPSFKRNKIRMQCEFSTEEKHGFLTTVCNMNSIMEELLTAIKPMIHLDRFTLTVENSIYTINDTTLTLLLGEVFSAIFPLRQTQVRFGDVTHFKKWLHSNETHKTLGKCLFVKHHNIITATPEYKRLHVMAVDANQHTFWNEMCVVQCNMPCNIVPFGMVLPSLKKKFKINMPFTSIAHLPVFYDGENILAIPHLNIHNNREFVAQFYEN